MIDIDAEFRRMIGSTSTTNKEVKDRPLTLADLKDPMEKVQAMGPPPPSVHMSKYAPALGTVRPRSTPITDDMRAMCDDIGPQKVPVAWHIQSPFGDMVVVNPVNVKGDDG